MKPTRRAALRDTASSQNLVRGLLELKVTGAVMVDIPPPTIDRFMEAHPQVGLKSWWMTSLSISWQRVATLASDTASIVHKTR
ncbi:hypothetical protein SCB29_29435 [Paraburkholderia sp. SIMBA_055]